jgi:hypothetical protein
VTLRRKHNYLILTAAGAIMGVRTASAQFGPPPPTVTLSISAADGFWTAYATTDSSTDNVGLAIFCIDVNGSDGISVTSSGLDVPAASFGNAQIPGTDGIGILGAQNTSVQRGLDGLVIENYAKLNAPDSYTDAQTGQSFNWTVPASLAEGTYSGNEGILTVTEDESLGAETNTLNIVSDGHWEGRTICRPTQ